MYKAHAIKLRCQVEDLKCLSNIKGALIKELDHQLSHLEGEIESMAFHFEYEEMTMDGQTVFHEVRLICSCTTILEEKFDA